MTPVTIRIRTVYRAGESEETSESSYVGKLFRKDGTCTLRYEESFFEDAPPVVTTLTITDVEARLHRKGDIGGDMIFREGETCEFFYRTGFGNLPMQIHTKRFSFREDVVRITLSLLYTLHSGGEAVSENEMEIEVGE